MSESSRSSTIGPAQPDPESVPDVAARPLRSLADRRTFGIAQGLLVGLTGCTPHHAAATLKAVAGSRAMSVADLAAQLIDSLGALVDENVTSDDAEAFVVGLEDVARLPWHDHGTPAQLHGSVGGLGGTDPIMVATPIIAGELRGVTVEGELDLATVPEFRATVAEVGHAGAGGVFLLNLAGLTFLDATGVRAFEDLHAATTGHGVTLRVARPIATAPRRLLRVAVDRRWLPPLFTSG